jgi:molybdate transport system substrate-binding protein
MTVANLGRSHKGNSMKIRSVAAAATFAARILVTQSAVVQAADVKFVGGAGFRSVMPALAAQFEKTSGHKIVATWDATGGIERRLDAGEAFDVVFVGPEVVDKYIKQGKIVAGTRASVARAGLAVAVRAGAPKPDVSTADAFKQALLNAKSVGYVGEGMSGAHFLKLLDRLKIADQMKLKLKRLDAGDIFKAAASGDAELIFFLRPAIVANKSVEPAGALPEDLQNYIVLATGLMANAPQPEAGKALIAVLQSDAATKIIRASGW